LSFSIYFWFVINTKTINLLKLISRDTQKSIVFVENTRNYFIKFSFSLGYYILIYYFYLLTIFKCYWTRNYYCFIISDTRKHTHIISLLHWILMSIFNVIRGNYLMINLDIDIHKLYDNNFWLIFFDFLDK